MDYPEKIFITGTDTDVGKTVVAAIMVAGLRAHYWKPIQSGLQGVTDTEAMKQLTHLPGTYYHPESYRLSQPLSPHASSRIDNVHIDLQKCTLPKVGNGTRLIVEGAGGIMVPLNDDDYMLDMMVRLALPVVVVARSGLGTINHTLLTLGMIRRHNLDVIGVVMNGPANEGNKQALEYYGKVKVLAQIEPISNLDSADLKGIFIDQFATV